MSITEAEAFVPERESPVRDELASVLQGLHRGCSGEWTTADLARAVERHPKDRTTRQAIQRLAELGVVYRNGDGRWHPAPTLYDEEDRRAS